MGVTVLKAYLAWIAGALVVAGLAAAQTVPPPPWDPHSPKPLGKPHTCGAFYPSLARLRHEEGRAIIGYRIAADGKVKGLHIVKSSGFSDLDFASLMCASQWRYKPATDKNGPIEVSWKTMVVWVLPKPKPKPKTEMRTL